MQSVLEHFNVVRQINLTTDDTPKIIAFYESLGFIRLDAAGLNTDSQRVYKAFTEDSDILSNYILPEYEMHSCREVYLSYNITEPVWLRLYSTVR